MSPREQAPGGSGGGSPRGQRRSPREDGGASSVNTSAANTSTSSTASTASSRSGGKKRTFVGCVFALQANEEKRRENWSKFVSESGGRLLPCGDMQLHASPTAEDSGYFTICSHGTTSNTFGLPDAARGSVRGSYVTKQWCKACLIAGKPLPNDMYLECAIASPSLPPRPMHDE